MLKSSTWQHLRIPFSLFLLPVFLFAFSLNPQVLWLDFLAVFFIMHFLVYPASNGYNSYFDKDEGSIGGVENPKPVSKELYWVSLAFDGLALLLALVISWQFAVMVFLYGLISKAYSHPSVRLKKYPTLGWLVVGAFQGYFTWWTIWIGLHGYQASDLASWQWQIPALLSSALLWGSYPMTQIYQHEEDAARGDQTISLKLGVKGTFHFVGVFFGVATTGYCLYFYQYLSLVVALSFVASLLPVLVFFIHWYLLVRKSPSAADFGRTMRLNWTSSICMILFFIGLSLFGH